MSGELFGSLASGPTSWTTARIVTKDRPAPHLVRLRMRVKDRQRHRPGQHYVFRLRAPDGYTAQRAYSVGSDNDDPHLEFLIERTPGGEVSEFLADVAEVNDAFEVRGPIGRWFRWDTHTPAVCLVGGTGVVPVVAMTRAARRLGRTDQLRVMAVARSPEELPYADELAQASATVAYTRHTTATRPPGPPTPTEVGSLIGDVQLAFVCGSSRFAEFAETILVDAGMSPDAIRVERFGGSA